MAKPFSYFPSVNENDAEGIIALPAPQEIVKLVDQFSRRINEYRSSLYNETELRNEFVNPFFAALGWDMDNRQGLAGDLKEVKVEESIRVEESVKNPDYSFRLGRKLKFFVETKKPSINIEGGIYHAFQLFYISLAATKMKKGVPE